MPIDMMDHYSIRTTKLEPTRTFYEDVMGLTNGSRPSFDFPGYWLYLGTRPVVHLMGVDAESKRNLDELLGEVDEAPLAGGGALDHIAFQASDLPSVQARLRKKGVKFFEREVSELKLHQIFLEDPNGIRIELNFPNEAGG